MNKNKLRSKILSVDSLIRSFIEIRRRVISEKKRADGQTDERM